MKKYSWLIVLALALTIAVGASLVACAKEQTPATPTPQGGGTDATTDPVMLDTPVVTIGETGSARWTSVPHSSYYNVSVDGVIKKHSVPLPVQLTAGQTISVQAVGNGTTYLDSAWSDAVAYVPASVDLVKLDTPVVTISDSGLASWSAIPHAVGYCYKFFGGREETASTLSVQMTAGQTITVKALGDGVEYADSNWSISQTFSGGQSAGVKLSTPAPHVDEDGVTVRWAAVEGASGYQIHWFSIYWTEDDKNSTYDNGNYNATVSSLYFVTREDYRDDAYRYEVRALGDGIAYRDSDWSAPLAMTDVEITPLGAPYVTVSDSGLASWEQNALAVGYLYKINGGEEQRATGTSVQLADGQSISVKALGNGVTFADSPWSTSMTYNRPASGDADLCLLGIQVSDKVDSSAAGEIEQPRYAPAAAGDGEEDPNKGKYRIVMKDGSIGYVCDQFVMSVEDYNRLEPTFDDPRYYPEYHEGVNRFASPQALNGNDISIDVTVRNRRRDPFVDLVLYLSWLDTDVVFNEGHGTYQCATTTVREGDEWVTHITIELDGVVFDQDCYAYIEIKEIYFLRGGSEQMAADLVNVSTRTREMYTTKESDRNGDFTVRYNAGGFEPITVLKLVEGPYGGGYQNVLDHYIFNAPGVTITGYNGSKTRLEKGDIPESMVCHGFYYDTAYTVNRISIGYGDDITYVYVPDSVFHFLLTNCLLEELRIHDGLTYLCVENTPLAKGQGKGDNLTTVGELCYAKRYLGTDNDPYHVLLHCFPYDPVDGVVVYEEDDDPASPFYQKPIVDPMPQVFAVGYDKLDWYTFVYDHFVYRTELYYPDCLSLVRFADGYTPEGTALNIPGSVNVIASRATTVTEDDDISELKSGTYRVRRIEADAYFNKNKTFDALVLGEGIEIIGRSAFYNLTSVTMPDTVKIIDSAFVNCKFGTLTLSNSLQSMRVELGNYLEVDTLVVPDSVTDLDLYMGKINHLTIGDGVTQLQLSGLSDLITLVLGSGVTEIPDGTFASLSALTSATMPAVVRIGDRAFRGCSQLETVYMPSVESIGASAFNGCASMELDELPEGLTALGGSAFAGCECLDIASLPQGVRRVAPSAFSDCKGLTSLDLSDVVAIAYGAFDGCGNLRRVTFGNGLLDIDPWAFRNLTKLSTLSIPDGCRVHASAFSGCTNLTSVVLGDGVWLGDLVFNGSSKLATVTLGDDVTLGDRDFYGCPVATLTIGSGVVAPNGILRRCKSLTTVDLSALDEIPAYAFADCTELTAVTASSTLTDIGEYAFSNTKLTAFDFPSTLKTIGDQAFAGSKLAAVALPDGLQKVGYYAFGNVPATSCRIPDTITEMYPNSFEFKLTWNEYEWNYNMQLPQLSVYGRLCYLGSVSNPYFICIGAPNGELSPGEYTPAAIHPDCKYIGTKALYGTSATIPEDFLPEGLLGIGDKAFACDSFGGVATLSNLIIPDSVTYLGSEVFANSGIQSVHIGMGLTSIGGFNGCASLSTVTGGSNVEELRAQAFLGCTSLTDLPFGRLKRLEYQCLGGVPLTTLNVSDDVESVDKWFFRLSYYASEPTYVDALAELPYVNYKNGIYYLGNDDNLYLVLMIVDPTARNVKIQEGYKIMIDDAFAKISSEIVFKNDGYADYIPSNKNDYYWLWKVTDATSHMDGATDVGRTLPFMKAYAADLQSFVGDEQNHTHYNVKSVIMGNGSDSLLVRNAFNSPQSYLYTEIDVPDTVKILKVKSLTIPVTASLIWGTVINIGKGVTKIETGAIDLSDNYDVYTDASVNTAHPHGGITVNYDGTMAEWAEIELQPGWINADITSVRCSDGVAQIQDWYFYNGEAYTYDELLEIDPGQVEVLRSTQY